MGEKKPIYERHSRQLVLSWYIKNKSQDPIKKDVEITTDTIHYNILTSDYIHNVL